MITKEECTVALENLKNGYRWMLPSGDNAFDKSVSILKELIKEHFESSENRVETREETRDNPPLKMEEIKEGAWIWDRVTREWAQVKDLSEAPHIGTLRVGIYEKTKVEEENEPNR